MGCRGVGVGWGRAAGPRTLLRLWVERDFRAEGRPIFGRWLPNLAIWTRSGPKLAASSQQRAESGKTRAESGRIRPHNSASGLIWTTSGQPRPTSPELDQLRPRLGPTWPNSDRTRAKLAEPGQKSRQLVAESGHKLAEIELKFDRHRPNLANSGTKSTKLGCSSSNPAGHGHMLAEINPNPTGIVNIRSSPPQTSSRSC